MSTRYAVTLLGRIVSRHRIYERAREAAAQVACSQGIWRDISVIGRHGVPITLTTGRDQL